MRNWRRMNSSASLKRSSESYLRDFLLPVLGLLGALLIGMLTAPRVGHASPAQPGDNFYETVGISLAVGTILGASTLPFYSQPGSALANVGIGAGIGTVIGLGIWTYELFFGSSEDTGHGIVDFKLPRSGQVSILNPSEFRSTSASAVRSASSTPTLLWLPLVSINW